jgi:hypothetical protein
VILIIFVARDRKFEAWSPATTDPRALRNVDVKDADPSIPSLHLPRQTLAADHRDPGIDNLRGLHPRPSACGHILLQSPNQGHLTTENASGTIQSRVRSWGQLPSSWVSSSSSFLCPSLPDCICLCRRGLVLLCFFLPVSCRWDRNLSSARCLWHFVMLIY